MSVISIKSCRSCLINDGTIGVFELYGNTTIAEKLSEVTRIRVRVEDGLLSRICLECFNRLENAYNFKRDCEKSDVLMKQFFFGVSSVWVLLNITRRLFNSNNK